ncbi:hypothetical protein EMIHUDRAFT_456015 [Emiliania huxleyi CCMP1516]|uniref:protein-tyrosine-phosphatase n=2 Tax=Emiliania huxleyi TaxID=2903 RepID=A0A0D3KA50_EMIH1|nr:hypothetical protein EMIHUDRAFT_456015 [Emiliania huxleyi CCMP1516]EOD32635.1 hypothetical protein EMIHUDRAFT_456015 [Emiliania huxleyi CCMP1516]|eukprot:XP_005785064.1 hypothetical protein EMIHUDRAFT_456015 [Emiliania huxleyi CCMP1516]
MTTGLTAGLTSLDLFNELQSRKNWPHGGPPLVLDLRSVESFSERRIRGSHHAVVGEDGVLTTPERAAWAGRTVVLVADDTEQASAAAASLRGAGAKRPLFLAEPFAAFAAARPFLTAAGSSSKAGKRPPAYPSCILPGLLYLGDIEDAVALPRLKEHLGVTHAITALADPPASLKAAVREAGVRHLWCAVRDVAAADIKEHFDKARDFIADAEARGGAVFVHCSRGVSRSASLGFLRCLAEFERELTGERSGVYIPQQAGGSGGEELDSLPIGEHAVYTFGRSLTCDVQLEHASASRVHAALVHAQETAGLAAPPAGLAAPPDGGLYLLDMNSSHGSFVDGAKLKPCERCGPLRDGSEISLGASSRRYVAAEAAEELERNREKKLKKKRKRWVDGPKQKSKINSVRFSLLARVSERAKRNSSGEQFGHTELLAAGISLRALAAARE